MNREIRLVHIGGGHGLESCNKAYKNIPNVVIRGITGVTDGAGSSAALSKMYSVPKGFGDLTRCIAAFSQYPGVARIMNYRFESGVAVTHRNANFSFVAGCLLNQEDPWACLEDLHHMACTGPHRMMPVSLEESVLVGITANNKRVRGEQYIDSIAQSDIFDEEMHAFQRVELDPPIPLNPIAKAAIAGADYIVVCPGSLFTSQLATLAVSGMREAIIDSRARLLVIPNIMTVRGDTHHLGIKQYLELVEQACGRAADVVLCHRGPIPETVLERYREQSKGMLTPEGTVGDPRFVQTDLWGLDDLGRVCHDTEKLACAMKSILLAEASLVAAS